MIKKDNLYYPTKESRGKACLNDAKIYEKANKDPIKFWENLAKDLIWQKKWHKAFENNPPYFKWFVGGKINITENIFPTQGGSASGGKKADKIALIWEPEPVDETPRIITYGELFSDVCRFANYLKKLGVKKGDRVGIYLPMIPEVAISMLACARIGAVHTVVFSAFSPSALRARLQDTEAEVLVTADGYYRRGQFIDLLKNAKEGILETKIKETIVINRKSSETPWQDESDSCEAEEMDSEDPLFILYTSGSTGKPKGVVHTCGGYTVQALWTGKWIFNLKQGNIFWCTADVGWVTGHTYGVYSPLLNGATTVFFEGAPDWPTPDRWAKIIEKHKVNTFYTAPTAIRMFAKYGAEILKNYKFDSLELLGSVGEPIDEDAWAWYSKEVGREKCPIVDTWWQTETGGILITSLPGIGPFKPSFTGLPFPGVQVDIKDGNLVILPPFAPGMLRGIYKNPEKYLETYWSQIDGVYFTSDGAIKDENGLIRIIGRVDDVIKVAGHRVSTGELENAVNLHPEIIECAVVGIPDEIKGEVPITFVVYNGSRTADEIKKEVIDQIKKEIGPIALPKEVYLVDDLPKTRSGKIMRRILKKLFTGEELGDLSTLSNPETVEKIKAIIKR
ncbi:MAG: acetate--CoA ligase [Patescibacteria group bacterium]|mgnify:FL=1